jgi:ubiquinol-cytochrome c reductase cytochrome b subunit
MVWVSGVLIFLVVPAFIVTGDLLPWDQKGYWTTQVRNSIISSVPVFGDFALRLLQGGPRTGIVALTRFYVLHSLFLPGLLILLIGIALSFLPSGPVRTPSREKGGDGLHALHSGPDHPMACSFRRRCCCPRSHGMVLACPVGKPG